MPNEKLRITEYRYKNSEVSFFETKDTGRNQRAWSTLPAVRACSIVDSARIHKEGNEDE